MPSTLLKNQPATDFAKVTTDFYVPPSDLGCCFPPNFRASNPLVGCSNCCGKELLNEIGPSVAGIVAFQETAIKHFGMVFQ
jgi:hypothetical protein